MKTYKVVPYADTIVIDKADKAQDAVVKYFDVINQESVDGWEFVTVTTVPVTRKQSGINKVIENYKAFIFVREE